MIYFTSDTHLGHRNAIYFDHRPFRDVEDMDTEITRRWNAKVKPEDTVYIIGDFIWKDRVNNAEAIIGSLNGKKILIKGNHDKQLLNNRKAVALLDGVSEFADITVNTKSLGAKRVILSHYFSPFYLCARHGAIMLHGHTHNSQEHIEEERIKENLRSLGYFCNAYNVGCMLWNYEPVTLDEIVRREQLTKYDFPL